MFAAIGIVLFAVLGQTEEEADVILLKDGTKRTGVIDEETDEALVLRVTVRGPKGDVTGKLRIARDQIAEIKRMPAGARAKADRPEAAPAGRDTKRAAIGVSTVTIGGIPWRLLTGDQFEVQTTCDEDFGRDVCEGLEEAHALCLRRFRPRCPSVGRQKVILLSGRAEYDEYMRRTYGSAVPDPAVYRSGENVLLACDCVQKDEAARMRGLVRDRRKEIDDLRKKTAGAEERNRAMIRGTRQELLDRAAEEKKQLRKEGKATPEALREVDRKTKAAIDLAEQMGRVLVAGAEEERVKADARIKDCEEEIRHNELLLRSQNRAMFETLLHECFHAFAQNRLRADKEIPRWLNEGMALCLEPGGDEARRKLYREGNLPALASVLRDGGDLLPVAHEGRIDRSRPAGVASWALAHYLATRMTPEQMDAYLADVASGADAADALAKALGEPLGKIDEAVRAHVASLR